MASVKEMADNLEKQIDCEIAVSGIRVLSYAASFDGSMERRDMKRAVDLLVAQDRVRRTYERGGGVSEDAFVGDTWYLSKNVL